MNASRITQAAKMTKLQYKHATCCTVMRRSAHTSTQPIHRHCITARIIVGVLLVSLFAAWPASAQTSGTVMPQPRFTAFDNTGDPISGGKLCTYAAGTTTPATTYSDAALSVPNPNPVVADSAGRMTVFLAPGTSYKFVLRTAGTDATCATGTVLWTQDNVLGTPSTSATLDVLGTVGESVSAGRVVYLSDGSGSKTAGQWFLASNANAYSSSAPLLGVAPNAIASGAAGTIRLGGLVTGLSSLTPGSTYYVGTAGAVTITTPTANPRRVGVAQDTSSLVLHGPGPAVFPVAAFNAGTSGTAITLNFSANGPIQTVTRTGNVTVTLTAPPFPGNVLIKFVHDATGTSYSVAWSPTVKWPSGAAPTFTNTANAVDIVTLFWDGATWYGVASTGMA